MNAIKALIKALVGDKAIWQFGNDAGSFFLAGITAAGITVAAPADGNWKPYLLGILGVVLNVAFNAIRRAWTQDQSILIPAVETDASAVGLAQAVYNIEQVIDLASKAKAVDPALYEKLIAQASLLLDQLLVKVPAIK